MGAVTHQGAFSVLYRSSFQPLIKLNGRSSTINCPNETLGALTGCTRVNSTWETFYHWSVVKA